MVAVCKDIEKIRKGDDVNICVFYAIASCIDMYLNTIGLCFILVVQLLFTLVYQVLFNTNSYLHLLIPSHALNFYFFYEIC